MSPVLQFLPFLFVVVLGAVSSKQNDTTQSHSLRTLSVTSYLSTHPKLPSLTTHPSAPPTTSVRGDRVQSHSITSPKSTTTNVPTHPRTLTTTINISARPRTSSTTANISTRSRTSTATTNASSRSRTSTATTNVSSRSRTSTTTTHLSSSSVTSSLQATAGFSLPVAAAWLYMSDSTDYKNIPKWWNTMDFTKVDVLYVAPLGVQNDSLFGLYSSKQTGPIETRFRWVIQAARTQNPRIKIIASQFWGGNPGHFSIWGYDYLALKNSSAIAKYATSVAGFMETWKSFYGGLDGYDVDFEDTNVTPKAPEILKEIRQKLSALDRYYFITVSPSTNAYLQAARPYIDYVNMQNYAGGYYLTPQVFTRTGFSSKQLLYGICPEASCHTRNVSEVIKQYKDNHLAGVHLWRLDSTNHPQEQIWQNQIYKALHPT